MPTYDYACSSCGTKFEIFEGVHDGGLKACPKCGKKKAGRLLGTGAGVIFRGSGFHVTDYRKGGSGGGSKPSEAPKKSESKGESKKSGGKGH